MNDPFHEPKEALDALRREITAVNSLSAAIVPGVLTACEQTVLVLYDAATDQPFPYQSKSFTVHKPGQWLTFLGVTAFYSHESQRFLTALDGYSLDKVRFPNEAAFQQYTNAPRDRAKELVAGVERFIVESEALLNSSAFLSQMKTGVIKVR